MISTLSTEARDYLADDLDAEGESNEGAADWYADLADHLRGLSPEHPLCMRLGVSLEPFLVDDDRIECLMYPLGEAVAFLENQAPFVDFDTYLENLTVAIEADHRRWLAHVAAAGNSASWTLESGPPDV